MAGDDKAISVDSGELLTKHRKWATAEKNDAANTGERRQAIGQLAEKTGIENKALSQFRAGLKIKNEGKRRDWLRSMEELLPIARNEIMGNQPEMELEPAGEDEVAPFDAEEESAAA